MRHVSARLGRRVGGSTGTNFVGVLLAAQAMQAQGREGSIVTILCDSGERYAHSYYSPDWYRSRGIDTEASNARIQERVEGRGAALEVPVAGDRPAAPERHRQLARFPSRIRYKRVCPRSDRRLPPRGFIAAKAAPARVLTPSIRTVSFPCLRPCCKAASRCVLRPKSSYQGRL